jgi:organic radical activating enzyme
MNIYDDEVREIKEVWDPAFFVLWNLGNQCTYKCSYCPETFHSGSIPFQSTENIQNFLKKLPKSHVMFTGGEATFHTDFEKIVLEKPEHLQLSVISNASRPIAFWERIGPKLKSVILTYHTEFAQFERFLATAELVYNTYNRPGQINLTMIPEKWDQCVNTYKKLLEAKLCVIPKPLLEDFGLEATKVSTKYTQEQLEWITSNNKIKTYKNIQILDKNSNVLYKTNPSELLSSMQTNFNNWLCYTNTQTMYIGMRGEIYMATCGQRIHIGSIHDDSYIIPTEPFVCKQNFCWCHSDILPRKVKL